MVYRPVNQDNNPPSQKEKEKDDDDSGWAWLSILGLGWEVVVF